MALLTFLRNALAARAKATASHHFHPLRLRATPRPVRIVEGQVQASHLLPKLISVVSSCHTLEQVKAVELWLNGLYRRDGITLPELAMLTGTINSTEAWLGRRFEPHKREWKWASR